MTELIERDEEIRRAVTTATNEALVAFERGCEGWAAAYRHKVESRRQAAWERLLLVRCWRWLTAAWKQ